MDQGLGQSLRQSLGSEFGARVWSLEQSSGPSLSLNLNHALSQILWSGSEFAPGFESDLVRNSITILICQCHESYLTLFIEKS